MGLSVVCLIHCLALPLLASTLPALGVVIEADASHSWVHWTLLALAVPVSTYALVRSLTRHRGRVLLGIGLAALLLLFVAVSGLLDHSLERPLTVLAASVLAVVHAVNYRRCSPTTDDCHHHGATPGGGAS